MGRNVLELPTPHRIADAQTKRPPRTSRLPRRAPSNVLQRFELSIKCFSSSSSTNAFRLANLISSSQSVLQLFLVARHVGIPSFDTSFKVHSREHHPGAMIVRSMFRFHPPVIWIISFLQSSPGFQQVLPRVGDHVIGLIAS